MRVLVDTHALIWAVTGDRHLSKHAHGVLASLDNEVLVSAASAWEVCTKFRLGKLPDAESLEHFSCYCIAYPQWANQAEALLPVTWAKASVMAASRLSTVRALAERSCCLIFDHACSMGLKSGE